MNPALARLREGTRYNPSYIVPLSDTDIEMLTYNSPRLRPRTALPLDSPPSYAYRPHPDSEDVQQSAIYQHMLAERPLPPIPARNPSRSSIRSAVLTSPLSDPFITDAARPGAIRLSAREGGITIRQVPQSSCSFDLTNLFSYHLLTHSSSRFARLTSCNERVAQRRGEHSAADA